MTNRYDTDFYGWTKDQADLLHYGHLDFQNEFNVVHQLVIVKIHLSQSLR